MTPKCSKNVYKINSSTFLYEFAVNDSKKTDSFKLVESNHECTLQFTKGHLMR